MTFADCASAISPQPLVSNWMPAVFCFEIIAARPAYNDLTKRLRPPYFFASHKAPLVRHLSAGLYVRCCFGAA